MLLIRLPLERSKSSEFWQRLGYCKQVVKPKNIFSHSQSPSLPPFSTTHHPQHQPWPTPSRPRASSTRPSRTRTSSPTVSRRSPPLSERASSRSRSAAPTAPSTSPWASRCCTSSAAAARASTSLPTGMERRRGSRVFGKSVFVCSWSSERASERAGERANGRTCEHANGSMGERASGRTGERANGRRCERASKQTFVNESASKY